MTVNLYYGDCLEILPTLTDKSTDAIITDLPYGTTACKWDVVIPFEPMWAQIRRLLKPRGAFVTTASQPFTSALVMSNPKWFRYCLVWDKLTTTGFLNAKKEPLRRHEDVCVFSQNGHDYNPQIGKGVPYSVKNGKDTSQGVYTEVRLIDHKNTGTRYPTSIIQITNSNKVFIKEHPTQKPVALYEYLIRTYTNEGDMVLDFCAGSGTTGVAAINTGRNCILIEKDAGYFEIAQKRITDAQAQLTLEMA